MLPCYINTNNTNLQIEKDDNKIIYFLSDEKSCYVSFKNKNNLISYIKMHDIKICKMTHINYNLKCNQLPF